MAVSPRVYNSCPFPIWAIFITTEKKYPAAIRPGTEWKPFWVWRFIMWCSTNPESTLNDPEELWGTASNKFNIVGASVRGWTSGAVDVVTDITAWDGTTIEWGVATLSNYPPYITAYMRQRIQLSDAWTGATQYDPYNRRWSPSAPDYNEKRLWTLWPNVIIDNDGYPQIDKPYQP